jgi:hypothetical protein
MEKMDMIIIDNYGRVYNYDIFTGSYYDCSIGTTPIREAIDSNLRVIEKDDVENMPLTKKLINDLCLVNLSENSLVGKLYDKNGFIYYNVGCEIYKFYLKINYFKKLYKKNESKTNGA